MHLVAIVPLDRSVSVELLLERSTAASCHLLGPLMLEKWGEEGGPSPT